MGYARVSDKENCNEKKIETGVIRLRKQLRFYMESERLLRLVFFGGKDLSRNLEAPVKS